jgi:L-amino acid N-acyltransferase YncA
MQYSVRPMAESDTDKLVELFNHFISTSFAAYPSIPTDRSVYKRLKDAAGSLPFYAIESLAGEFLGFTMLRKFHPADTMAHVAEVTIFLSESCTHTGIGTEMLKRMEEEAKGLGIRILMASASSRNEASLGFQRRNGFVECGRFKDVVHKFGEVFDMVWMQKFL